MLCSKTGEMSFKPRAKNVEKKKHSVKTTRPGKTILTEKNDSTWFAAKNVNVFSEIYRSVTSIYAVQDPDYTAGRIFAAGPL